ncbi:hypothetical protein MMC22_005014 [Lobaria immixta]|nr:hypothetical protein [Lobaria immixta]
MIFTKKKDYNSHQVQLIYVTSFCLISSTLAVGLRLLARRKFGIKLWWDDYIAVLALIFTYVPNILTLLGLGAGLGLHSSEVSTDELQFVTKTIMAHQFTWWIAYDLIIITILLLYIRLFSKTWLRKTSIWAGILVTLWSVLNNFMIIFQCTPVRFFWDRSVPGGHCIQANHYYAAAAAISMIMIIAVFCLPLPILWKLQISKGRKVGLATAFAVGAFACFASIMRLILVLRIDAADETWTIATPLLWGLLEIGVGVVSACIPSLMPLFLLVLGKKRYSGREELYTKYGGENLRSDKSKFNRVVDLGLPAPLPEGLALSPSKGNTHSDSEDIWLVHGRSRTGDILVTNQIVQVSHPTSRGEHWFQRTVDKGTGPPFEWEIQPPPQTHVAGQGSKL